MQRTLATIRAAHQVSSKGKDKDNKIKDDAQTDELIKSHRPPGTAFTEKSSKYSSVEGLSGPSTTNGARSDNLAAIQKTEVAMLQEQMKNATLRISQTVRQVDNISLYDTKSYSASGERPSNQMQYIQDQCERAQSAMPIEYYARQLHYKKVARNIIEVDERIEYNARTWKRTLRDLGIEEYDVPVRKEEEKTDSTTQPSQPETAAPATENEEEKTAASSAPPKEKETKTKYVDGYDSEELDRLGKQIEEFMLVRMGDDEQSNLEMRGRCGKYSDRAMSTIRKALGMERAKIDDEMSTMTENIQQKESSLNNMRAQTEALETEIKDLSATELIVREVVDNRFKSTINNMNDHILKQEQDKLELKEVIESLDLQRKKVLIMFDEVRSRRLRSDPFIRKRAQDLVRGLMQKLDDKETKIQEERESVVRENFQTVLDNRAMYQDFLRKISLMDEVFAFTVDEIAENIARIAKEKVEFTGKARVLKVKDEEVTAKLQKIESVMAEYARGERRKAAMENKKRTKRGQDVGAMSTESYINSLSNKYFGTGSSGNNGDSSTDTSDTEDTASDSNSRLQREKKLRAKRAKRRQNDSISEVHSDSDLDSLDDAPANGLQNGLAEALEALENAKPLSATGVLSTNADVQLTDEHVESVLGVVTEEEKRQEMIKQPVAKIMSIDEALRLSPEFARLITPPAPVNSLSEKLAMKPPTGKGGASSAAPFSPSAAPLMSIVRFTPVSLREVDTDMGHSEVEDEADSPTSPSRAQQSGQASPRSSTTKKKGKGAKNMHSVSSTLCTACYIKLHQDFVKKGPTNNYARIGGPRLSVLKQQSIAWEKTAATKRDKMGVAIGENSFQFNVDEGIKVVIESLERLRDKDLIEAAVASKIRELLVEVTAMLQLQKLTEENASIQYRLHKICVALIKAVFAHAPKTLLVQNTRSLFAEAMACLMGLLGVIFNVTLSFWVPAVKPSLSGIHSAWVDQVTRDLVDTLMSHGIQDKKHRMHQQAKQSSQSSSSSPRRFSRKMSNVTAASLTRRPTRVMEHLETHFDEEVDEHQEMADPTLLLASAIGVLQRSFSTSQPDAVIAPTLSIVVSEMDSLIPDMLFREQFAKDSAAAAADANGPNATNPDGSQVTRTDGSAGANKASSEPRDDQQHEHLTERTYDLVHRNGLGILSVFLVAVFHQTDLSGDDVMRMIEQVKREGAEIGTVKSSFSVAKPVVNIDKFDDFIAELCFPQVLPGLLTLELMKRVIEQDISRRIFLQKIINREKHVVDLQFLNVNMPVTAEFHMHGLQRELIKSQGQKPSTGSGGEAAGAVVVGSPGAQQRRYMERPRGSLAERPKVEYADASEAAANPHHLQHPAAFEEVKSTRESLLEVQKKSLLPVLFKRRESMAAGASLMDAFDGMLSKKGSIAAASSGRRTPERLRSVLIYDPNEPVESPGRRGSVAAGGTIVGGAPVGSALRGGGVKKNPVLDALALVRRQNEAGAWDPVIPEVVIPGLEYRQEHSPASGHARSGPNHIQNIHDQWIAEKETYILHLCQQINHAIRVPYMMNQHHRSSSGGGGAGSDSDDALGPPDGDDSPKVLPLPDPLVQKILSYVENLRKIVRARRPDGYQVIKSYEQSFKQCLIDLRMAQKKILSIVNALTFPMKRRLMWLQEKLEQVLKENVEIAKTIEEQKSRTVHTKRDVDDIAKSLQMIVQEKTTPGFNQSINLLRHSLEVQRMILDYANEEFVTKIARLKEREATFEHILAGMQKEFERLVGLGQGLRHARQTLLLTPRFGASGQHQDAIGFPEEVNMETLDQTLKAQLEEENRARREALAAMISVDTTIADLIDPYFGSSGMLVGTSSPATKRTTKSAQKKHSRGAGSGSRGPAAGPHGRLLDDSSLQETSEISLSSLKPPALQARAKHSSPFHGARDAESSGFMHFTKRWEGLMSSSRKMAMAKALQSLQQQEQRQLTAQTKAPKLFGFGKRIDEGLNAIEQRREEAKRRMEEKRQEAEAQSERNRAFGLVGSRGKTFDEILTDHRRETFTRGALLPISEHDAAVLYPDVVMHSRLHSAHGGFQQQPLPQYHNDAVLPNNFFGRQHVVITPSGTTTTIPAFVPTPLNRSTVTSAAGAAAAAAVTPETPVVGIPPEPLTAEREKTLAEEIRQLETSYRPTVKEPQAAPSRSQPWQKGVLTMNLAGNPVKVAVPQSRSTQREFLRSWKHEPFQVRYETDGARANELTPANIRKLLQLQEKLLQQNTDPKGQSDATATTSGSSGATVPTPTDDDDVKAAAALAGLVTGDSPSATAKTAARPSSAAVEAEAATATAAEPLGAAVTASAPAPPTTTTATAVVSLPRLTSTAGAAPSAPTVAVVIKSTKPATGAATETVTEAILMPTTDDLVPPPTASPPPQRSGKTLLDMLQPAFPTTLTPLPGQETIAMGGRRQRRQQRLKEKRQQHLANAEETQKQRLRARAERIARRRAQRLQARNRHALGIVAEEDENDDDADDADADDAAEGALQASPTSDAGRKRSAKSDAPVHFDDESDGEGDDEDGDAFDEDDDADDADDGADDDGDAQDDDDAVDGDAAGAAETTDARRGSGARKRPRSRASSSDTAPRSASPQTSRPSSRAQSTGSRDGSAQRLSRRATSRDKSSAAGRRRRLHSRYNRDHVHAAADAHRAHREQRDGVGGGSDSDGSAERTDDDADDDDDTVASSLENTREYAELRTFLHERIHKNIRALIAATQAQYKAAKKQQQRQRRTFAAAAMAVAAGPTVVERNGASFVVAPPAAAMATMPSGAAPMVAARARSLTQHHQALQQQLVAHQQQHHFHVLDADADASQASPSNAATGASLAFHSDSLPQRPRALTKRMTLLPPGGLPAAGAPHRHRKLTTGNSRTSVHSSGGSRRHLRNALGDQSQLLARHRASRRRRGDARADGDSDDDDAWKAKVFSFLFGRDAAQIADVRDIDLFYIPEEETFVGHSFRFTDEELEQKKQDGTLAAILANPLYNDDLVDRGTDEGDLDAYLQLLNAKREEDWQRLVDADDLERQLGRKINAHVGAKVGGGGRSSFVGGLSPSSQQQQQQTAANAASLQAYSNLLSASGAGKMTVTAALNAAKQQHLLASSPSLRGAAWAASTGDSGAGDATGTDGDATTNDAAAAPRDAAWLAQFRAAAAAQPSSAESTESTAASADDASASSEMAQLRRQMQAAGSLLREDAAAGGGGGASDAALALNTAKLSSMLAQQRVAAFDESVGLHVQQQQRLPRPSPGAMSISMFHQQRYVDDEAAPLTVTTAKDGTTSLAIADPAATRAAAMLGPATRSMRPTVPFRPTLRPVPPPAAGDGPATASSSAASMSSTSGGGSSMTLPSRAARFTMMEQLKDKLHESFAGLDAVGSPAPSQPTTPATPGGRKRPVGAAAAAATATAAEAPATSRGYALGFVPTPPSSAAAAAPPSDVSAGAAAEPPIYSHVNASGSASGSASSSRPTSSAAPASPRTALSQRRHQQRNISFAPLPT